LNALEEHTTALAEAERQFEAEVARIGRLRAATARDLGALDQEIDDAAQAQMDVP
jgi:hypothetical protein